MHASATHLNGASATRRTRIVVYTTSAHLCHVCLAFYFLRGKFFHTADCTIPEASSTATLRLTGSRQDAVLYPANRAVDLQRMSTSIEISRVSSRATTEVSPKVVLDDADEDNTESTVNESQNHTTVPEDGPQINDVPSTEDSDGTDTVPSARQAVPSYSNENATDADASANTTKEAVATDNTETPPRTRCDPESTSKPRRFSRMRNTKNPHYAYDRILAHDFSRSDPEYNVRWTNRPSNEDSWEPRWNLPFNAVNAYHRRQGLEVLEFYKDPGEQ